MQRVFARISPNFPKKLFCDFCLQIFSHKNLEDPVLVQPPKKGLLKFFCKRWELFLKSNNVANIGHHFSFPRFSRILPMFLTNQNFWACTCNPIEMITEKERWNRLL